MKKKDSYIKNITMNIKKKVKHTEKLTIRAQPSFPTDLSQFLRLQRGLIGDQGLNRRARSLIPRSPSQVGRRARAHDGSGEGEQGKSERDLARTDR
jgi:hypothetical protein